MTAYVGPAEIRRIRECIAFGEANPKRPTDDPAVPDDPRHLVQLEVGVRCVLTFDEGLDGVVWRHLSVSHESLQCPPPLVASNLALLFGFTSARLLLGPIEPDRPWIFHIVERWSVWPFDG